MAVEIQNLGAVPSPNDADVFPVVQAGVTYKETRLQIVAAEKTRAEAAEAVLTASVVSEAASRVSGDATNATAITVETAARIAADALLIPLTYLDTDGTLAANSDAKIATQKATKTHVATLKSAVAKTLEDFDASPNLFPTTYGGSAIKKGDRWSITVTGTLGTQVVAVGDSIEAKIDAAAVEADFAFFNTNTIDSSSTAKGIIEIATTAEGEALTDTARAIVPSVAGDILDYHLFRRTAVGATPFAASATNYGILGVTLAGAITINLPAIASLTEPQRVIYKVVDERGSASSGAITINGNGANTINGSSSLVISEDYGAKTLYNDGTNWFVESDKADGPIKFKEVTINTAEVLTLNSVPVEIIPAPGAGKMILILSADAILIYNTITYATNTDLQLKYSTGTTVAEAAGFLAATNSPCKPLLRVYNSGVAVIQAIENKAVLATVATGDPTAGNSLIRILISYRIR